MYAVILPECSRSVPARDRLLPMAQPTELRSFQAAHLLFPAGTQDAAAGPSPPALITDSSRVRRFGRLEPGSQAPRPPSESNVYSKTQLMRGTLSAAVWTAGAHPRRRERLRTSAQVYRTCKGCVLGLGSHADPLLMKCETASRMLTISALSAGSIRAQGRNVANRQ